MLKENTRNWKKTHEEYVKSLNNGKPIVWVFDERGKVL